MEKSGDMAVRRNQILVRIQEIETDLKGINPNLSIYKRMEAELRSILRELEALQ